MKSSMYYHGKAWNLFGKDKCEICNKSLKIHFELLWKTRFHMHCVSQPKDYEIMLKENWLCLCPSCHSKIEKDIKLGKVKSPYIPQYDKSTIYLTHLKNELKNKKMTKKNIKLLKINDPTIEELNLQYYNDC